jgi:perosamine synthetase
MHSCLCLDSSLYDCAVGLTHCILPWLRIEAYQELSNRWSSSPSLPFLSVRSALHCLFSTSLFPENSEIIVSGINIPDVPRIIRDHNIKIVPVDVDLETLRPTVESMEAAITSRTRAILIAHLYGSFSPLDDVSLICRRNGLLLIEDCAEAFRGPYSGHQGADVSFFSFGPIKFATAFNGCIATIRNESLFAQMHGVSKTWPVQSRFSYLIRLLKFTLLVLLQSRVSYWLIVNALRALGFRHQRVLVNLVRSFRGPNYYEMLSRQPCASLVRQMLHRVSSYPEKHMECNRMLGKVGRSHLL